MTTLPRTTPEKVGVAAQGVIDFLAAMTDAKIELHSFMLLRHGRVAAEAWWEPYSPHTPHLLYSLSKSFTSVAAGIAESDGLLHRSDLLRSHLPEAAAYGDATIADALRMSVGHLTDPILDPSIPAGDLDDAALLTQLREYAPERSPGEIFTYDQLATFAVAKIVERAAGTTLLDYLRPRLFAPLGATEAKWAGTPGNLGFTGLYLTTESIARFGQLLLQRGRWEGEQLVPAEWVDAASSVQMPNDAAHRFPPDQPVEPDSACGYGYQFWIGQHGFHGGGAFSQICLVLPDQDAVIAITASAPEGQTIFDGLWTHVLPALDSTDASADARTTADAHTTTAPHTSADTELRAILSAAEVPPPRPGLVRVAEAAGRTQLGLLAGLVVGLHGDDAGDHWATALSDAEVWAAEAARIRAEADDSPGTLEDTPPRSQTASARVFHRAPHDTTAPTVRFGGLGGLDLPELTEVELADGALVLTLAGERVRLPVAADRWQEGSLPGRIPIPVAVRGGWSPAGIFEAEIRMVEGPHVGCLGLDPDGAEFAFFWREPTLSGPGLEGYRV